jgi:hypothetical protein
MSYCHVSRQCDDHAHGEMVADAFHTALNNRIDELTHEDAKYYPFSQNNCMEAFGFLTNEQEEILVYALKTGKNDIGLMLAEWVQNFWTLQAEKQAIEELSR